MLQLYFTLRYFTLIYFTLLYFTLLYFILFYFTLLYFTLLYFTLLYFTLLYFTLLYFTLLYFTLLHGAQFFLRSWPVFAASQEIPPNLCNPKILYRTQKCPLTVPILSQLQTVPMTLSPNIILPSTSGYPQ
jgi:hypothetical protein